MSAPGTPPCGARPSRLGRVLAAWVCAWACSGAWGDEPAAAQAELGRAIYDGTMAGFEGRVHNARDASLRLPAASAACVSCHRPSGLGSFEGGVAVPPIAGDLLFNAFDGATTHRYAWTSTLRLRPAYNDASLREVLRSGLTPDGLSISAAMPRYDLTDSEAAALAAHLRGLNTAVAPGVDEQTVRFATITTPDVAPAQVNELLATLNRFVLQKNANTRGETARRGSALRNEQTMYRRHRRWELSHWALLGEPHTWARQLEALYAREPVFAVLSGVGHQTWQPVHDFCRAQRLPCLLPTLALPPQVEDFYSVYFSRGVVGQAQAAAEALSRLAPRPDGVQVLGGASAAERAQAGAIADVLIQGGLNVRVVTTWHRGAPLVSALAPAEIEKRRSGPAGDSVVFVLAGTRPAQSDTALPALSSNAQWVTDQLHGPPAERQLVRARAWLHANALRFSDDTIARHALLAGSVAVESLVHVDDKFSRDYCIEKLEHNLENMPALTAYPRLAIGPRQRFAAKTVMLVPMAGSTSPQAARH